MIDQPINILNDDDVIQAAASAIMFQNTFTAGEYLAIMQSKLEENNLFGEGIECELLSPNEPWQKGKFRVRLEFCPDEIEVPRGSTPPVVSEYGIPQTDSEDVPLFLRRATRSVGMWS